MQKKVLLSLLSSVAMMVLLYSAVVAQSQHTCPSWEYVNSVPDGRVICGVMVNNQGDYMNFHEVMQDDSYISTRVTDLFPSGTSYESFYLAPFHKRIPEGYPEDTSLTVYVPYPNPTGVFGRLTITDLFDGTTSTCWQGRLSSPITVNCNNLGYVPNNAMATFEVFATENLPTISGQGFYQKYGVAIRRGVGGVNPTPTRTPTITLTPSVTQSPTPSTIACGINPRWVFSDGEGTTVRANIIQDEEYLHCVNQTVPPIVSGQIKQQGGTNISSAVSTVQTISPVTVQVGNPFFGITYRAYTWTNSPAEEYFFGAPSGSTIRLWYYHNNEWTFCGSRTEDNEGDITCFLAENTTVLLRVSVTTTTVAGGYGIQLLASEQPPNGCPTIGGLTMNFNTQTLSCCVTVQGNKTFTTTQGRQAYELNFPNSCLTGFRGSHLGCINAGQLANWTYRFLDIPSNRGEMCNTGGAPCNATNQVFNPPQGVGINTIPSNQESNALNFYDESIPFPSSNPAYNARQFAVEICSPSGSQSTPTPSPTPTRTPTVTRTGTPPTATPTCPVGCMTPIPTINPSATATRTRTATATRTPNPSHSATPTLHPSITPSITPTNIGNPPPTNTPLPTTNTPIPTGTPLTFPTFPPFPTQLPYPTQVPYPTLAPTITIGGGVATPTGAQSTATRIPTTAPLTAVPFPTVGWFCTPVGIRPTSVIVVTPIGTPRPRPTVPNPYPNAPCTDPDQPTDTPVVGVTPVEELPEICYTIIPRLVVSIPDVPLTDIDDSLPDAIGIPAINLCTTPVRINISVLGIDIDNLIMLGLSVGIISLIVVNIRRGG